MSSTQGSTTCGYEVDTVTMMVIMVMEMMILMLMLILTMVLVAVKKIKWEYIHPATAQREPFVRKEEKGIISSYITALFAVL